MVCHYLSQATLRLSASLVSRRWNVVCNLFIRRTVLWKAFSSDYDQFVLDTLREVISLECWLYEDPDMARSWLPYMPVGFRLDAWQAFWPKLLAPIKQGDSCTIDNNNDSSVDSDSNLCLMDTIRHLRLLCLPFSQPVTYLDDLQPHFRSLRSLELRIFGGYTGSCAIFILMDNSPQLRSLKISGPRYGIRQGDLIAGDNEDSIIDLPEQDIDPETAHFHVRPKVVTPPNKSYPQRYKLEVVDAFLLNVHQRVLERLISTWPELRILRVLEANAQSWTLNHGYTTKVLKRLFDHAKDCCQRLVSMEVLPRAFEVSDPTHLHRIAKFFPDAIMLTLNCSGYYMPDALGLEARRLLSQSRFCRSEKRIRSWDRPTTWIESCA